MQKEIIRIRLQNELDIVLAYRRTMQLGDMTGMPLSSSTKFATAVSEICRNTIEYVGEGEILFYYLVEDPIKYIQATIRDHGRGIANLTEILDRKYVDPSSKGCGIVNSRKLVDSFDIKSSFETGTTVALRKFIPKKHPPINNSIIDGWRIYFSKEIPVSPYEEIKRQNSHLFEYMETLRIKNIEAEHQIEEIRRLNVELEKSNKERDEKNQLLVNKNKELDDFAYTVSHDLKAPLRNIEGLFSILEETIAEGDGDQARQMMKLCKDQLERMDTLIVEILNYAKSGKQNLKKKLVSVKVLLEDILQSFNFPPNVHIEVASSLPVLLTEEIFLQQIFNNLISNAVKYHDKQEININIGYEGGERFEQFFVEDDGPGISQEHQNKIFELFESLPSNKKDSTGVGLSIVKKIVEGKGGSVWVESYGRGSKFIFTWPVEKY